MTVKKLVLLSISALALSGCSIRGQIDNLSNPGKAPAVFGQQQGFVSGGVAVDNVQGYQVSASLGSVTDAIKETKNGYTVYMGLQGSVAAEVLEPEPLE